MKTLNFTIIAVILIIEIYGNSFAQSGWISQNSNTNSTLRSVFFISDQIGWITGGNSSNDSGKVLKTTNGGINWIIKSIGTSPVYSVFFISSTSGWIAADDGKILKTEDGGTNWVVQSNTGSSHRTVQFVSSLNGWVISRGAVQLKTTNSGLNWTSIILSTYNDGFFISGAVGWIVGGNIKKTTDGGNNWNTQYSGGIYTVHRAVNFLSSSIGWVAGDDGNYATVLKTTNGGDNWSSFQTSQTESFFDIQFIDANTGWSIGQDQIPNKKIFRSTNGGANWELQTNGSGIINALYMLNVNTGWAVGENGIILKTTNSGITPVGINIEKNNISGHFSLEQNYPNPFNPTTKIKFDIPDIPLRRGVGGMMVTIKIYDALGREVAVLVNSALQSGTYEVDWNASQFPSGIYFYKLETPEFSDVKKMVLLR
jgi:photosystem II stability/assembly factor-like uncharacterized protein